MGGSVAGRGQFGGRCLRPSGIPGRAQVVIADPADVALFRLTVPLSESAARGLKRPYDVIVFNEVPPAFPANPTWWGTRASGSTSIAHPVRTIHTHCDLR